MKTSKHFTFGGKQAQMRALKIPASDLESLKLDAEEGARERPESAPQTAQEHIPVCLEYSDSEGWYWRYGKERLWGGEAEDKRPAPNLSWNQLHCFLTNYAWTVPEWRFIFNKPCWPLHIDVVELVVGLYYGRSHYERNRDKSSPREILDMRALSSEFAAEARRLLERCEVKTGGKSVEGGQPGCWIDHTAHPTTSDWIESLLHRVLDFEDSPLPPSPVMTTTADLDRLGAGFWKRRGVLAGSARRRAGHGGSTSATPW